ncbi:KGG domain-containing protein [Xylophilus sp.]|uniref:KGG domain-containing protein n=1 Tax=Xylophilus sp. TaxID=2653893 RepID=UPI0013B9B9CD|nr:KGG domain-containing protein [Xylophilus sp.]KAF1043617.1 MAG: hypothetical protein GAK38_03878 [Xylophilus sp.]
MASNNPQGHNQHTGSNEGQDNKGNQGGQNRSQNESGGSNRGFAAIDPERQREIASQGGKAAHESGNAHEFTSQEAREAGAKSHGGHGGSSASSGSGSQNQGDRSNASSGQGQTRGGSSEQHAEAGRQSHKNDNR